jgi:hypothetical protein
LQAVQRLENPLFSIRGQAEKKNLNTGMSVGSSLENTNFWYRLEASREQKTEVSDTGREGTLYVAFVLPELEFLNSLWGLGTEEEKSYRTGPPGYMHRLAEFIPWNRFLGFINV